MPLPIATGAKWTVLFAATVTTCIPPWSTTSELVGIIRDVRCSGKVNFTCAYIPGSREPSLSRKEGLNVYYRAVPEKFCRLPPISVQHQPSRLIWHHIKLTPHHHPQTTQSHSQNWNHSKPGKALPSRSPLAVQSPRGESAKRSTSLHPAPEDQGLAYRWSPDSTHSPVSSGPSVPAATSVQTIARQPCSRYRRRIRETPLRSRSSRSLKLTHHR